MEELCSHTECYTIFPSDKLAAQVPLCLPIGWVEVLEVLLLEELCEHTVCYTIFPSERLAAQVLGVRIGWFHVLGEIC